MTKERYIELVRLANEVLTNADDHAAEYSPHWDILVDMSEMVMELHKDNLAKAKKR